MTACPTGIAHTYMAADALAAAAERADVDYHVETQGSSGAKPLDPAVIAAADAVIFAVDVDVRDKGRFAGKPVVQVPVKRGIDEPDALVAKALAAASDPNAPRVPADGGGDRRNRRGRRRPVVRLRPQAVAAHRRQLHDPVRRGGRSDRRARPS